MVVKLFREELTIIYLPSMLKKTYKITGKQASTILQKNNITVNKNTIPNDTESPFVTSGIRVGTPAMTTKGFKEKHFIKLANLIHLALKDNKNIKNEVKKLISSAKN